MTKHLDDFYEGDSSATPTHTDWYSINFHRTNFYPQNAKIQKLKYQFIPAVLYWNWNSTVAIELNSSLLEREFRNEFQQFADSTFLREKLGDAQLRIDVDSLEESSFYTDKGHVIILIFAYAMIYGEYIVPEKSNYIFSYQIIDENGISISKKEYYPNRAEPMENSFRSTRNFVFDYLNERRKIRQKIYSDFFNQILAEKRELEFYEPD